MILTKKRVKKSQRRPDPNLPEERDQTRTLGEHLGELQSRFFSIAILFLLFSVLAYPFFDTIVSFLLAPLGDDHKLVYLTPGGAFGFIIQACMYIGFVMVLPLIIYNLYRFIMPVVSRVTVRRAIIFTFASFVLSIGGIGFAYYVSLPAALYFLTGFELHHIDPMLTIDSYFSFIMMYMLVGAVLFQIPLIMLLINGFTPLGPKKLMGHQDKIVLTSFIIAALISPTPDVINQTLLASPMIVMYQVGIVLVWMTNSKKAAKNRNKYASLEEVTIPLPLFDPRPTPMLHTGHQIVSSSTLAADRTGYLGDMIISKDRQTTAHTPHRIDGLGGGARGSHRSMPTRQVDGRGARPTSLGSRSQVSVIRRSTDGFLAPTR